MNNDLVSQFQEMMLNYGVNLTSEQSIAGLALITAIFVMLIVMVFLKRPKTSNAVKSDTPKKQVESKSLTKGLEKTRTGIISKLRSILNDKKVLNSDLLEDIHEVLFRTDMGFETADYLIEKVETHGKSYRRNASSRLHRSNPSHQRKDVLVEFLAAFRTISLSHLYS